MYIYASYVMHVYIHVCMYMISLTSNRIKRQVISVPNICWVRDVTLSESVEAQPAQFRARHVCQHFGGLLCVQHNIVSHYLFTERSFRFHVPKYVEISYEHGIADPFGHFA